MMMSPKVINTPSL